MTPEAYEVLHKLLPSPRFYDWIKNTLQAQAARTHKEPPQEFYDTLITWCDLLRNPPLIEIELSDAGWEEIYKVVFEDNA